MTTTLYKVERKHVGHFNVGVNSYCYGLAYDSAKPVYIDMVAPTGAVDAIYNMLNGGRSLSVQVETDSRTIFPGENLRPEFGSTKSVTIMCEKGMVRAYRVKLDAIKMEHAIILHRDAMDRKLDEAIQKEVLENKERIAKKVYLLHMDRPQMMTLVGQSVLSGVTIPIFENWYPYISAEGVRQNLVQKLPCYGGIRVWSVSLDTERWTKIIQDGLKNAHIRFPKGA